MRVDEQSARRWALVGVLLIFTCLSLLYAWLVPPYEGPDEPEHFAYVTWLAQGKGFPPQGNEAWETPVRQEASQPPIYYLVASLPVRFIDLADPPAELRPNPYFPSNAPGSIPDNKNFAIHYPGDLSPLRGGWLALYISRLVSLLLGILFLVAVYGLTRQIFPGSNHMAFTAALFAASIPQVLFMSGLVSNDMAAAATGALTLWMLAILIRKGANGWRGLALGVAFSLVALSKVSGLTLIVPIIASLFWLIWSENGLSKPIWRTLAGFLIGTFAIGSWWYIRSWIWYGSPLGLSTHYQASWAIDATGEGLAFVPAWIEVFMSTWAAFGWGNIKFDGWVYFLIAAFVLAAIAGLLIAAWRWWHGAKHDKKKPILIALLALALVSLTIALQIWMQQVTAPHGRLLFPVLAAIAILTVVGWRAIHSWVVVAGIGGTLLLAILSPLLLIRPAYALPEAEPQLANNTAGEPRTLDWRFDDSAELVSLQLNQNSVLAGEVLSLELCWRPLIMTEENYSVMVHIVGPENSVVAGRHTYPGLGSYPTTTWQPDRPFCDVVRVDIPNDLKQTLLYKVEVGLLNAETGQRLPAFDDSGGTLNHTFADSVRLQSIQTFEPSQAPGGEDLIRLVKATFPGTWKVNQDQNVVLLWWLAEDLEQDYTVYLHLRDPQSGEIVAQGDGPPVNNWYPTSVWQQGEFVEDNHAIALPTNIEPGNYELFVGWYDLASGTRLGQEHYLGSVGVIR